MTTWDMNRSDDSYTPYVDGVRMYFKIKPFGTRYLAESTIFGDDTQEVFTHLNDAKRYIEAKIEAFVD